MYIGVLYPKAESTTWLLLSDLTCGVTINERPISPGKINHDKSVKIAQNQMEGNAPMAARACWGYNVEWKLIDIAFTD